MNSCVISTLMFAYWTLIRRGSFLIVMNRSISGWSTRMVSMSAPRRPAWETVLVLSLNRFMNAVAPGEWSIVAFTGAPSGRSAERSVPTPPPVRYTIADSVIQL